MAQDCELDTLGRESLLGHLLLRGLQSSEEKLREKIIVDAEGTELRDVKVSRLIATSEMYRSSARQGSKVNKVGSQPGARGNDTQRDPSKKQDSGGLTCFKCGGERHYKSNCKSQPFVTYVKWKVTRTPLAGNRIIGWRRRHGIRGRQERSLLL